MDIAAFRAAFPEFAIATDYPDAQVTVWSTVAEASISADTFANIYPTVVYLYTAHSLVLARKNQLQAASGGIPGGDAGAVNSKSVGTVKVGFDSTSSAEDGAGHWNQTTYGREYIRLVRLFGAATYQA